ncbi:MAG: hypothetical protein PHD53_08645, partial [Methylococcales bacterium]|nr:hypothetical protein [Methylococcales bacterium]
SVVIGKSTNPVISFRSLIPKTLYIDPIKKKADRPQKRADNPYLIALDTSNLPRAHERILDELDADFPIWNHVSGVMLFESRFWTGIDSKEWIVSLHPNPHADIALPPELMKFATRERIQIKFLISEKANA